MFNNEKLALVASIVFLALPGLVIGLKRGPQPGVPVWGLLGGVLAALLVGGALFLAPQFAIEALFQRPEFKEMMHQVFPEDFFGGQLRLPIDAAILSCAIVPLAFAAIWGFGLPRWLGLLALPLALALAYLAIGYQGAQDNPAAPLALRMTIEATTMAAALVTWEAYFLLMGWLARSLRPDIPGR